MASDSIPGVSYDNGFMHRVSLSHFTYETHHVPLHLVQVQLNILVSIKFRLFNRIEPSVITYEEETVLFDLTLLRHRDQLHRLLAPMFENLGVNTDTVKYDEIINKIIQQGLGIVRRLAGLNVRVLYLRSVMMSWVVVDETRLESLMERMALEESALELETNNYGMVPATESSVEEMVTTVKVKDGDGDCTVCLEGFDVGSNAARMPCSHMFHGECIEKWLKQSHYCPVCRFELPC